MTNGFEGTDSLIYNKYWNTKTKVLDDVDPGYYTIQHHLVTPTGQNIFSIKNKNTFGEKSNAKKIKYDKYFSLRQY